MEAIEMFRTLRDACDGVIKAMESEDAEAVETALGRFMVQMMKLDALK